MYERFTGCTNPYWIRVEKDWIPCPCGKCYNCLQRDRKNLYFRCREETAKAKSSFFLTLTYSDENLPIVNGVPSLCYNDCRLFLQRIRKPLRQRGVTLRMFYIGEYGGLENRPHYHFAIWLNERLDYNIMYAIVQQNWKDIFKLNYLDKNRLHYLVKYFNKIDDRPHEVKPFRKWSKGLGASFITPAMTKYLKSAKSYTVSRYGYKTSLPRYLRDKIFSSLEKQQINEDIKKNISRFETDFIMRNGVDVRSFYSSENSRKLANAKNVAKIRYSLQSEFDDVSDTKL